MISLKIMQDEDKAYISLPAETLDFSKATAIQVTDCVCSGLTLALFLIYVCPDASEFLRKLRAALEANGNKAA